MKALALAAAVFFCAFAHAQPYPAKPVRIIVNFPAGGVADVYARIIGARVQEAWGQPVVVENRTGAGGNIGAEAVAKSAPDGYRLNMSAIGPHAVNVSLFSKMPYDPVKDFAAIALVLEAEGLLVVHASVPANNVGELIAYARAYPGKLTFASAGTGTASHLAGELFKTMAKVEITHVPYKGNVPAITDLLAGQTSLLSPRCRPSFHTRKPASCVGLFAPAGTPASIVQRWNAEVMRIMQLPEIQARLPVEGARFAPNSPGEFAQFVKSEIAKWAPVVKASGARVD